MISVTEACRGISDEDFDIILDVYWEQIALFAFEGYRKKGRGAVFLDRKGQNEDILQDQVDLGYAIYKPGLPDPDAARMLAEYDPAWDIVFQYLQPDGNVRTVRIRTAPDNRHPWRIFLFERLLTGEKGAKDHDTETT